MQFPGNTFLAEDNDEIVGAYYLKNNHHGPGSRVCNCDYMVASETIEKGIAKAICCDSQAIANTGIQSNEV